jgi:hypothetical protein
LLLRSGTIVDATIIAAPSSTKNASAIRDPEMKQTRKGRNWFFGMKLHVGTDRRGIVHTVSDRGQRGRHYATARPATRTRAGSLRRPGVLEGSPPRVSRGAGAALPDQSAAYFKAAVERALADDQPRALADPSPGRARLSRRQATMGLRQGEIPRLGQEPGPSADHVRTGQPLPSSQTTASN